MKVGAIESARWREPAIAAAAAVVATLAYVFCRLQALAGVPLCSGGGATPAGLLCLLSGANAAAVVLVAALVWRKALRIERTGHGR